MKAKALVGPFSVFRNRLSLQISVLILALFIGTVVAIATLGRSIMQRELLAATQRYSVQVLDQVNRNIDYYIKDMESIAQIADSQSAVLSLLFQMDPIEFNRSAYYHSSQNVRQLLADVSSIREEMVDIIIAGENGAVSDIINSYITREDQDMLDTHWYRAAVQASGNSVLLPPYMQKYTFGVQYPVISIARSISMYPGGDPLGVILIELKLEALNEICSAVTLNQSGYIFIVDREGNFIYHPDNRYVARTISLQPLIADGLDDDGIALRALSGDASFVVDHPGGRQYVTGRQLENADWMVVGVIPYEEIYAPAARAGLTQMVIGIVSALVVSVAMALLLGKFVFLPIHRLQLQMRRVQRGDFDVEVPVTSSNEIGQLSRGFNTMTRRIAHLMETQVATEQAKRKAELAALHAQINPHFLYNTLDTIVWMAEYKPSQASIMASELAKLFRLALAQGSEVVTLGREMEYVGSYLAIQQMRYKRKFTYSLELEPDAARQAIPKLVVQVLVENAIYHGIKPKRLKCLLLVRAFCQGDEVAVQVVDDGVGITPERLQEVLRSDYSPSADLGGIGIRNIRERLQLYFGERAALDYYSIPGAGTVTEIRVPFRLLEGTGEPEKQEAE